MIFLNKLRGTVIDIIKKMNYRTKNIFENVK